MPSLQYDQVADLVNTTLQKVDKNKFEDLASAYQHYEVMPRLAKQMSSDTGDGHEYTVAVTPSSAAKNIGLFEVDDVNVEDHTQLANVPFRHTTTNWAYDMKEKFIQGGPEKIVDEVMVREKMALIGLAEQMEQDFWGKPASSSDKVTPFGIDYWLVSNTSTGFNGGNASGFSDGPGGLSATTYTAWKNWTAQYTNVTKADLIQKMRKAHRETNFRSPVDIPSLRKGPGQDFRIYVNGDTIEDFEELGEAQNENLGRDLAPMDGMMTFRKNPIIWIPILDDNTNLTDPIYMINWNTFGLFTLKGNNMRTTGPIRSGTQHDTWQVHKDVSWNTKCVNRRMNALITK